MFNSQRPHGLQSTRLLRPWDFPGKSTGVGCHCLLLSKWHHLISSWINPSMGVIFAVSSCFLVPSVHNTPNHTALPLHRNSFCLVNFSGLWHGLPLSSFRSYLKYHLREGLPDQSKGICFFRAFLTIIIVHQTGTFFRF